MCTLMHLTHILMSQIIQAYAGNVTSGFRNVFKLYSCCIHVWWILNWAVLYELHNDFKYLQFQLLYSRFWIEFVVVQWTILSFYTSHAKHVIKWMLQFHWYCNYANVAQYANITSECCQVIKKALALPDYM